MGNIYKRFAALAPAQVAWLALVCITACVYLYGLGSPYTPTNGDEMVYIHIARMTAESGHWLPLQSELLGTRNTKPPLLIWQAMAAGEWGRNWTLWALRLPSILYTFATTGLLAFFAYRLADERLGKLRTACLAASVYLLFFSTFRYGRVYLTSAPETFWLALPMWWVLWLRVRFGNAPTVATAQPAPLGWLTCTLIGVTLGLGSAYKSFALVAPAAAAIWCAVLLSEQRLTWTTAWRSTLGLVWSTAIGIGIFALWFVLDPDPAAVWQEFVVAENAGKMSGGQGYWHAALYGAYPMWTQLLAYPANAGLLALPVLGFCWFAIAKVLSKESRRRTAALLSPGQWVLLAWVLVWLVVFTIPSQRSGRYVIPAMPALALSMALVWQQLPRIWFWLTLLITIPALVMLARIGWVMGSMGMASMPEVAMVLVAAGAGIAVASTGFVARLFNKNWARNACLVACLALYATFGLMVAPISKPQAHYSPAVQTQMQGQRIAVPNGFTGQYERYHFVLRGARITPYDFDGRNTRALYPTMPPAERLDRLLNEFNAVVWIQDEPQDTAPSCVPNCKVLAQRWHVKSRHKSGEVTFANLWHPQEWLFRREWLVVKE
jgi:4-amino-4-deoxy-L-arabinose transferase-like glycosyltransferase